jgi:outer membrane protein OmpA-like peptidoglycan-associated protein
LVLARDRALVVVDYLAGHGLERSQMVARGYGDAEPRVSGAEAPAGNRRVDFGLKLSQRCSEQP